MKSRFPSHLDPGTSALSRRQLLQWSLIGGMAFAATPALTACSADEGGGKIKLVHASQDPLILWAVTYLAEDHGYYKDEGLEVERVLMAGGPPALTALLSGDGGANLSGPGELLAAVGKGQRLRLLMAHTNTMPGIIVISREVAKRVGITADSPLADRQKALGQISKPRIGITAPGSVTDGIGRLAISQAGLDPTTEAQLVPLGTASNSIAAMGNGQIDGFFGFSPGAETAIEQLGAVPLLINQAGEVRGGDRFQGMTLQARAKDLEANRESYEALVRADVKALKSLVDNPVEAGKALRTKRFGHLGQTIWDRMWDRIQDCWGNPYITEDSIAAWFDAGLVDSGESDGSGFPYDEVIDMDCVDAAVKAIGWSEVQQ